MFIPKKRYLLMVLISILMSGLVAITHAQIAKTTKTINSLDTIIQDMTQPHAAAPKGVPKHYDWAKKPDVSMGNNPQNMQAAIAWGQLYEPEEGNPAKNTRVQIRNIKAYILSKSQKKWQLLQSSVGADGGAYREDFAEDISKPADVRQLADGSIAAKAGNGYNYHFWTKNGRTLINPNDIGGVFTTVQARLIVDNPNQASDIKQARYLLGMGGDYWLSLSSPWDNFQTHGGIGVGRLKYVTSTWQAFNMITLSPEEIRKNPPPIE